MSNEVNYNDIRQQMLADDMHYHAERLVMGGQGLHEGWTPAEQVKVAVKADISAETRHQMIAVGAYYLAEKRGFAGNGCDQDWIKAAAEIDAVIQDHG